MNWQKIFIGGNASYPDASTLGGSADIAYVMDDGLTSLSANDVNRSLSANYHRLLPVGDGDYWYLTFIGTGLSYHSDTAPIPFAQNLPYGTHVLLCYRDGDSAADFSLDGVAMDDISSPNPNYGLVRDFFSFHQPKMPPIPEDACVIADYMLMADFVEMTGANNRSKVSKGVRRQSATRDFFFDENAGTSFTLGQVPTYTSSGYQVSMTGGSIGSGDFMMGQLVYFGGKSIWRNLDDNNNTGILRLNASGVTSQSTSGGNGYGGYVTYTDSVTLGVNTLAMQSGTSSAGESPAGVISDSTIYWNVECIDIATPIHTSHHYQTFETPFLHELVGGDRNMEQTNLVVSPDGKTWDEVTRDTSYINNWILNERNSNSNWDGDAATYGATYLNVQRGTHLGQDCFWKDWVHAYDRWICLKDGYYMVQVQTIQYGTNDSNGHLYMHKRSKGLSTEETPFELHRPNTGSSPTDYSNMNAQLKHYFRRGDSFLFKGRTHGHMYSQFSITRL